MVRMIVILAAGTALAGCAARTAPPAEVAPPAVVEAVPPPAPAPKAQIGSFGFDNGGMDETVVPGDNFYQFANGTWVKNTPIPADKSNYGMFTVLDDLSRDRTKADHRGIKAQGSQQPDWRHLCQLHGRSRDRGEGPRPVHPVADGDRARSSKTALATALRRRHPVGIGTPFGGSSGRMKGTEQYIAADLPVRPRHARPRLLSVPGTQAGRDRGGSILTHLTNVLTLAGEKNAAARAKAIVAFETKIAKTSWTKIESRDATKTYNKMTLAATAAKIAPGFDFDAADPTGAARQRRDLDHRRPAERRSPAIAGLINKSAIGSAARTSSLVRRLRFLRALSAVGLRQEKFAFYGTTLSGTPRTGGRAGSAASIWSRRRARARPSASSTSPAISRPRPRPSRRAGPQHDRGDGPPHRQARPG